MAQTPPLNPNLPMVDEKGRPTPFFMRWWQEQVETNRDIADLSTPAAVSTVLDVLGAETRGQVIYRGAALWELLNPDLTGKVFRTNGAGADPSWDTISSILDDALGDTRGSVLYRGASGWAILTPGTALQVLTTNGASADPTWEDVSVVASFLDLTDTPANYTGQGGKAVAVNVGETALEFIDFPSGGGGGGGGGDATPLGFAAATKPGNTLTAFNGGSPAENAYDATYDIWRIYHTTAQAASFALKAGLTADGVAIFKTHIRLTGSSFHTAGVSYGENSSGRRTAYTVSFGGVWRKQFWNGTTFVSESTITPTGINAQETNVALAIWWKFERSGGTITVSFSFNGLSWYVLSSGTTTENAMSDVDRIGIFLNTVTATGQENAIELWGLDTSQQDEIGGVVTVVTPTGTPTPNVVVETETEYDLSVAGNNLATGNEIEVDLTDCFEVVIRADSGTTGTSGRINIELSADGGATWDTGASDYENWLFDDAFAQTSVSQGYMRLTGDGTSELGGRAVISDFLSANTKTQNFNLAVSLADHWTTRQERNVAEVADRLRIRHSGGAAMTGGRLTVVKRARQTVTGGGNGNAYYDIASGFLATPTVSQVFDTLVIGRNIVIPANFSGSVGTIGTNPTSSFAIDVQDDGVSIGTITISTGGVFTFATTSGTAQSVAAGSVLTFVGPNPADATAAACAFTIIATTDGTNYYDIQAGFSATPTASLILETVVLGRTVTFPANFSGSVGDAGTNPTATFAIDVQDDGVSIGTISVSTGGVFTFTTTSGTAKIVAAGSVLTFTAPGSADATAADIYWSLIGEAA